MELNERKLRILKAVIDDYIATALPVGSRTLMKKYISELSAATIRNEMSDLEEMGFLDSPHTSAGRVPSYKAYRYYVDRIVQNGELNREESKVINRYFNGRLHEVEEVIKNAARVVSDLTDYTSLAITPQLEHMVLRHIQLVPVSSGAALVVIVTDTAIMKDAVVRVPHSITPQELSSLSAALTTRFAGRPLRELGAYAFADMAGEMEQQRIFFRDLTEALSGAANAQKGEHVVVDGALNIFHHPEYAGDVERAQNFLMALNAKDKLRDMMSRATKWEFTITIGPENEYPELRDTSVVTATYRIGDQPLGTVGVIGPTRMDYQRVLRVLNHMGRSVGEMLSTMLDDDVKRG